MREPPEKIPVPLPASSIAQIKGEFKRKAAMLLALGHSYKQIARKLGYKSEKTIYQWLRDDPQMFAAVAREVQVRTAGEMGRNISKLIKIRDTSENDMASIRAIDGLDVRAGLALPGRENQIINIQIGGQQVNLSDMSGKDLDTLIRDAAQRLGPEVEKIIEAELVDAKPEPDLAGERVGTDGAAPATPEAPKG